MVARRNLLGVAMLALVAVASCKRNQPREGVPAQTTTTGAEVPASGCAGDACDGGAATTVGTPTSDADAGPAGWRPGLHGPSLIPAPAAPTSPASEVRGGGGAR